MDLIARIEREGPKKLLAIDGGGIRGVLALEVLQKIEDLLKAKSGRADFRLADYFDYIAGTSTGGIIAAGLSIGMSVKEILDFYQEAGAQMFVKANLLRRLRYKFEDEPLAAKLREVFDPDTTLGSEKAADLAAAGHAQRYAPTRHGRSLTTPTPSTTTALTQTAISNSRSGSSFAPVRPRRPISRRK